MFQRVRDFFYRHRRKFIASGIIVGGAVLASRFVQRKFIEWQEKQAKEFIERSKKHMHFESTERTCNQTVISLSINVKDSILKLANTKEHIEKLKTGPKDKLAIWDELKTIAFAKHSTFLYSGLMLVVTLRVQLNILGGYLCRESLDPTFTDSLNTQVQDKYLGLCQSFIQEGVQNLFNLVKRHVMLVVKDVPLSKKLLLKDIENIFWAIQASLSSDDQDPLKNLPKYMFCQLLEVKSIENSTLNKVIEETVQILESEEVKSLTVTCLSRGYANSLDSIADNFTPELKESQNTDKGEKQSFNSVVSMKKPLAKVIPLLIKLDEVLVSPEPWIQQYLVMEELRTFGANIYEAFSYSDK